MRQAIAVIAGYVLWSTLWLTGNMALRFAGLLPADPGQAVSSAAPLVLLLIASMAISVVTGYVAASILRTEGTRAITVLGVLLLATGIFFEIQSWHLLPLWYHLAFLVLLIPGCLLGARLRPAGPLAA
jgi:hypothetical protein